jgi:hypothetical protein
MLKKEIDLAAADLTIWKEDLFGLMLTDPGLDLSHATGKRLFDRSRERHGPQPEDWMHSLLRSGHQELWLAPFQTRQKPRHEIGGKEGRVRRGGDHKPAPWPIGYRPFDASMDARKGSYLAAEAVNDDRQAEGGKPAHVTIGVEDEIGDLGPQAVDDVGEHWLTGERKQAFVAATHAARFAACK